MITIVFISFVSLLFSSYSLASPTALNILARDFESEARHHNEDSNRTFCYIFQKVYNQPDNKVVAVPYPTGESLAECTRQCPTPSGNGTHSIACVLSGDPVWSNNATMGPGIQSAPAVCACDSNTLDTFATVFVESLPTISEIVCEAWVAVLTGVVDFLIDTAIDSVEQLVDNVQSMGGMSDGLRNIAQGALQFHAATDDLDKGRDCFGKWIASLICSAGALSQDQTDSIFNAVYNANQVVVTAATLPFGAEEAALDAFQLAKMPKGIGDAMGDIPKWKSPPKDPTNPIKPRDKPTGKETVKKTAEPTQTPKDTAKPTTEKDTARPTTTDPLKETTKASVHESTNEPKSTESLHASTKTTSSKSQLHSSQQTSTRSTESSKQSSTESSKSSQSSDRVTITSVLKSVPSLKTITMTCTSDRWKQACAHYYSAIKNYGNSSVFTCGDDYASRSIPGTAIGDWTKQHEDKTFHAYTASAYDNGAPNCKADVWPPAMWLLDKGVTDAFKPEWGQRVRWLPGSDSDGASSLWKDFCQKNDGGYKNAQRVGKDQDNKANTAALNTKLVDAKKAVRTTQETIKESTTTVIEVYDQLPYTRAVFALAFDNATGLMQNDWLLRDNPCWPSAIVPEDPDYALLYEDKWYQTASENFTKSLTYLPPNASASAGPGIYRYAPDAQRLARARQQRPDVNRLEVRDVWERHGATVGLKLVYEEGQLMVRDTHNQITRSLTQEEMKLVEFQPCSDRNCLRDRASRRSTDGQSIDDDTDDVYDNDHEDLFITGHVGMTPSKNIAIPTMVTKVRPSQAVPLNTYLAAGHTGTP